MPNLRVTYDPGADAAYIALREIEPAGVARTCSAECSASFDVGLDFDHQGRLVGIEIIGARGGLPSQLLQEAERPPTP